MSINGQDYPIRKGSCFLIRPGDQPQAVQDPEDRLQVIFIHFDSREPYQSVAESFWPPRCTYVSDTFYCEMLLNKLLESESNGALYRSQEFDLLIKALFILLYREHDEAGQASELGQRQQRAVRQAMAYLRARPSERVSYAELAESVELSQQYLSKIFKKVAGCSIKQFIIDVRLERALSLLQETSMNVSQVGEALGYSNIYLFSKQFKQRYGQPPSHFTRKGVVPRSHPLPPWDLSGN